MGQHIFKESDVFIGHFTSGKPVGIAEILKAQGKAAQRDQGQTNLLPAQHLCLDPSLKHLRLSSALPAAAVTWLGQSMPRHGDSLHMQG